MSKVDKCICCKKKKIGVTQAELETGDHLCITENTILIAMFCIFQCVKICSMFDPLMITNLLMRLSLLILNTKHYGIKISKFISLIFYQPQMRFFDNYIVSGILRIKMDMAYPYKKKQKILLACVVTKIEKLFLQNRIAD